MFQETDGDRFFGREKQIEQLWDKFRAIAESAGHGQSIFEYAPKTKGASAFKALAGPGWYRCLANKLHHPLCAIGRTPSAKGDRSR